MQYMRLCTEHATVHRTCDCTPNMRLYTEHATVHRACDCTSSIRLYTEQATVHRACDCTLSMRLYTEHATVHRACDSTPNMRLYTEHATAHRACDCTPSMRLYTEHATVHMMGPAPLGILINTNLVLQDVFMLRYDPVQFCNCYSYQYPMSWILLSKKGQENRSSYNSPISRPFLEGRRDW